jgi:hypothetical protein
MKRKFKQWWLTMPPTSTKRTITSHLKSLNTKKTMTYYIGNSDPCLGLSQQCDGVKPVKGIPTFPSLCIYNKRQKSAHIRFHSKGPHNYLAKTERQHNTYGTIASVLFSRSTNLTCCKPISTFYAYSFLLLSSFDKSSN